MCNSSNQHRTKWLILVETYFVLLSYLLSLLLKENLNNKYYIL